MVSDGRKYAMGWLPDYPDIRDYTKKTEEVKAVLTQIRLLKKKTLPKSVDLLGEKGTGYFLGAQFI